MLIVFVYLIVNESGIGNDTSMRTTPNVTQIETQARPDSSTMVRYHTIIDNIVCVQRKFVFKYQFESITFSILDNHNNGIFALHIKTSN